MRRYPLFVILIILAFVGLAGDKAQAQGGQPDAGAFDTAPEVSSAPAAALGTAFTYQGQLKSGGTPYNGACDFQFKLYDASSAGAQIGATQTASNVSVSSGVFTTPIDFGAGAFDGNARWLDISAHCPAGSGSYTTLAPRQALTPAPYAFALPGFYTQQNATSPNLIGGHSNNSVTSGVRGATISGGGNLGAANRVTDDYGTVGGGRKNQAGNNAGTTGNAVGATVGGGSDNTARAGGAMGGGLALNPPGGVGASVGGGFQNVASGNEATVPGGYVNSAAGAYTFAAGRFAKANHDGAFVWGDGSTEADFSSTASNQFLIRASGGMGVGTNAPTNQLHVAEAIDANATVGNHVALIENNHADTSGSQDVLALRIKNVATPDSTNNFITFFGANSGSLGSIEGNGSGSIVLSGAGADYAEWLPRLRAEETFAPGDIVGMVNGRITKRTRSATQWMVISANALVAGSDPGQNNRDAFALVAFIGQAPVRVRGAVQSGDFIIPSGSGDGIGIAVAPETITAEQFAQAVGQAWESSDDTGVKPVRVAIGLTRGDPTMARLVAHNRNLETRLAALEQRGHRGTLLNGLIIGLIALAVIVVAKRPSNKMQSLPGAQSRIQ